MYLPKNWFSDLLVWCAKYPALGLAVVAVTIGVLLWSPWQDFDLSFQLPPECIPESMVTFSFDDGYKTVYTKAFPILKKYDFVATVYVVVNNIGKPGYMTKSQLRELAKNGWWIGSHTLTHPHLTEIPLEKARWELKHSRQVLQKWGFKVVDFASPYGDYNEKILELIKEYYFTHRTTEWGLNKRPIDRYQLKYLGLSAQSSFEEIKEWILKAKKEKAWVIIGFHQIDYPEGPWTVSSKDLEKIVKFVKEQGYEGFCPFANLE